jgi:hypothetical protein
MAETEYAMIASAVRPLDYALLLGQGRSGTNFLLALLNQSARTHCRNEPDQSDASALASLRPYRFFVDEGDQRVVERLWDEAIFDAAMTFGPRDHIVAHPKEWLFPGSRRPGFFYLRQRLLAKARLEGTKAMDVGEIRFPGWMTKASRLEKAFHVFKLNAAVGLATWMFSHRSAARGIHIVRHPGGFVKSWMARWVRGETHQERGARNKDTFLDRDRLRALGQRDETWAVRMGEIEAMGPVEAELWWWRYVNETIWQQGQAHATYHRLLFEELAEDPTATARGVFEFCGLPWTDVVSREVTKIASGSRKIARAWKDELAPEVVEIVERVLADSPMTRWWEGRS